jgi:hypothetical protein
VAGRSAALGFDGKWVLHPGQIDAANETFSPRQEDYDHAENILDAYDWYTSEAGGKRGRDAAHRPLGAAGGLTPCPEGGVSHVADGLCGRSQRDRRPPGDTHR